MRREELLNQPFETEERSMRDDFRELARTLEGLRKEIDAINSRLDEGVHSLRDDLKSGAVAFDKNLELERRVKDIETWIVKHAHKGSL